MRAVAHIPRAYPSSPPQRRVIPPAASARWRWTFALSTVAGLVVGLAGIRFGAPLVALLVWFWFLAPVTVGLVLTAPVLLVVFGRRRRSPWMFGLGVGTVGSVVVAVLLVVVLFLVVLAAPVTG